MGVYHHYHIIRYVGQGAGRESTFLQYPCYGSTVDWQCTSDDHLLISNKHWACDKHQTTSVLKSLKKLNACGGVHSKQEGCKARRSFWPCRILLYHHIGLVHI